MTEDKSSSQSEAELVERLRREAAQVPEEVSGRLRAIRAEAIAQTPASETGWRYWRLAGMAAATAMLAVAVMVNVGNPEVLPQLPVVDVQELAVVEDMELLEQLEFLAWLEEAGPNAG